MKWRKGWRMSSAHSRHFTYVRALSPTLPSLYLRHRLFSNPSFASPTSQVILQLFFRFSFVTGSSLTSPGEPPMVVGLKVRHIVSVFQRPDFSTISSKTLLKINKLKNWFNVFCFLNQRYTEGAEKMYTHFGRRYLFIEILNKKSVC